MHFLFFPYVQHVTPYHNSVLISCRGLHENVYDTIYLLTAIGLSPGGSKKNSLRTGFEPVRVEPIGFQVQLLNHSDTAAKGIGGKTPRVLNLE